MLLWFLRSAFMAVMISLGTYALVYMQDESRGNNLTLGIVVFLGVLAFGVSVIFADMRQCCNKQITTISAVYFGLLVGLVLGTLFSLALEPLFQEAKITEASQGLSFAHPIRLFITSVCCYVSVSFLLQTKDEFRFIIPYVEFSKQMKGGRPLVLDTSVIIDGRIADICDTRIIDTKMIVPQFVLRELQHIADSADKLKRNRGRRGLDMLKRMQTNPKVELQVHEANMAELREVPKVDERLVIFAKAMAPGW